MSAADGLKRYWEERAPKERLLLCAAAIALAAALLYLAFLEPALAARKQLTASLPRLRAQLEDMHRQQKEIAMLRKRLDAASQRTDLKALLQPSVARTSFASAVERLEVVSGDKAVMLAAQVPFDDWLTWAESLQREFGIRVETCRIGALEAAGMARIEATFTMGQSSAPKTP